MNDFIDSLRHAFRRRDNAVMRLIAINLIVFLTISLSYVILFLIGKKGWYDSYVIYNLAIPASTNLLVIKVWTVLTYFFTHERLFHLLGNVLMLFYFGKLIHQYIGNRRVINLYVLGGLAGAAFYVLLYNVLPILSPNISFTYLLGASASIFAIMVAAATLLPEHSFYLIFLGPIKIKYIALVYVLISFFSLPVSNFGGNIAHLGGALTGYLYIVLLRRGTDIGAWVSGLLGGIERLFSPKASKPKMKGKYVKSKKRKHDNKSQSRRTQPRGGTYQAQNSADAPSQDEINRILDKINESGYESLTTEEKQTLFRASDR